MNLIFRLAVLVGFVATVGFAQTWTGELVSGRCFAAVEDNIGPDGSYYVSRDIQYEMRVCSPRSKTHHYRTGHNTVKVSKVTVIRRLTEDHHGRRVVRHK